MPRHSHPFGRTLLQVLVFGLSLQLNSNTFSTGSSSPPRPPVDLTARAGANPTPALPLQSSGSNPTGGSILIGQKVSGVIANNSDADAYRFQGVAGESVSIAVNATAGGLDPTVTLFIDPALRTTTPTSQAADGSHQTTAVATANASASTTSSAGGIIGAPAVFSPGDVFAAVGNGKVKRFSPSGTLLQTLDTGSGGVMTGMGFDSAGNLYATVFSGSQVFKFDINGNLIGPFGSGYNAQPESIAFDTARNIYVGQAGGSRQVLKFNSAGTMLDSFTPATEDRGTDWIELAADQRTLFYTSEAKNVKRYDLSTKTQLSDFNKATLPGSRAFALRLLPNGSVIVADQEVIVRLDASGNVAQTYDAPGEDNWFAVNLDPDGQTFWSGNISTGKVYRFNIATGAVVTTFDSGKFTFLGGIAIFGELTAAQVLKISKSAPPSVVAGSQLTYTITSSNTGTANATNVVIKDTLPVGTTFVSATDGGVFSNGVVTWNIGTLNAGVTGRTLSYTVSVSGALPIGTLISNSNYTIEATGIPPIQGPPVTTTVGKIIHDDNSGGGVNALIKNFQLPFTGTYTVLVASARNASSGGYELSVTSLDNDSNVAAVSVASGTSNVVAVASTRDGKQIFTANGATGTTGGVGTFLGFSPDGASAAVSVTSGSSTVVAVVSTRDGRQIFTANGATGTTGGTGAFLGFSPDGASAAVSVTSGATSVVVAVASTRDGKQIFTANGATGTTGGVGAFLGFSLDGDAAAVSVTSGSTSVVVAVASTRDGKQIFTANGATGTTGGAGAFLGFSFDRISDAPPPNPNIDVMPTNLEFGNVTLGQSKDLTLTVSNTGRAALTVSSFTSSDSQFRVTSPATPFTIAVGGQPQTVTVRFTRAAVGNQVGTELFRLR